MAAAKSESRTNTQTHAHSEVRKLLFKTERQWQQCVYFLAFRNIQKVSIKPFDEPNPIDGRSPIVFQIYNITCNGHYLANKRKQNKTKQYFTASNIIRFVIDKCNHIRTL